MAPFWANFHHHLVMQFAAFKQRSSIRSAILADFVTTGSEETHQTLPQHFQKATAPQTKFNGGNKVLFDIEDKMWLSMWHFQTTRPEKMVG